MDRHAEVVLGVFEAVEQRNRARLIELFHEHVEFHESPSLPYGGLTRGKRALREQFEVAPEKTWIGTWEPLQPTDEERRMDPRVVTAGGEEVVVLYRQRAVGADGERFDASVLGLYEVRDGKLVRAQMFHFDTAAILEFLGRAAHPTSGMAA
jgi:ketosteroid isomerase-like protein